MILTRCLCFSGTVPTLPISCGSIICECPSSNHLDRIPLVWWTWSLIIRFSMLTLRLWSSLGVSFTTFLSMIWSSLGEIFHPPDYFSSYIANVTAYLSGYTGWICLRQSVSQRNKCMYSSLHALCSGCVQSCAIYNSFAWNDGKVIHDCCASKAESQWTQTLSNLIT